MKLARGGGGLGLGFVQTRPLQRPDASPQASGRALSAAAGGSPVSGRVGEGRTVHRFAVGRGASPGPLPGPCLEDGGSWCFIPAPTALLGLPPGV